MSRATIAQSHLHCKWLGSCRSHSAFAKMRAHGFTRTASLVMETARNALIQESLSTWETPRFNSELELGHRGFYPVALPGSMPMSRKCPIEGQHSGLPTMQSAILQPKPDGFSSATPAKVQDVINTSDPSSSPANSISSSTAPALLPNARPTASGKTYNSPLANSVEHLRKVILQKLRSNGMFGNF